MKFKKAGAAILAATITVAGSGYVWADENLFKETDETIEVEKVDESIHSTTEDSIITEPDENVNTEVEATEVKSTVPSESYTQLTVEENATQEEQTTTPNENSKDETNVSNEGTKNQFPTIPEGYKAGNLLALKQAYENAGNETAKAAILRNAHKAIAKFEAKQASLKEEVSTTKENNNIPVTGETKTTTAPTVTVQETEATKATIKEQQKELKQQHQQEKKELKEKQQQEKKELKEKQKSEKQANKNKQ